uniref:NADH-ubiquinone oxidoreductase chain 2 n=1 Tax=Haemopis sanguisuga TaxID=51991 RepID=A0A7L7S5K3_9ANNE|nr:NADH dehydrogenase subunit 2 [Haemopis sanguisuga]
MNFTSIIFSSFSFLILSTLMLMSSNSWLVIWICLELNMFSFIPIIMWNIYNYEEEGAIKYFIIQILASSLLLISIFYSLNLFSLYFMSMLSLMLSVCIKVGSFPFYFWYPSVMKSMSWFKCLILSTWQKLGPLSILIFYIKDYSKILIFISLMNIFIGGWMGFMQSDLRALMAYSSISHLGWMMSMMGSTYNLFSLLYFLTYLILVIPIFSILMLFNIYKLTLMFSMSKVAMNYSFSLMLLILSLSGLPPLSGFMPKLMVLSIMMNENMLMVVMMVIFSSMSMYMYLNMFFTLYI